MTANRHGFMKAPPRKHERLLLTALLVYFLASGLVLPASGILYRVLSCLGVLLVGLHLHAKGDIAGYAKLALVVTGAASEQVGYFFVFLTAALFRERLLLTRPRLLRPIYALMIYGLIVTVVNQSVELNLLAYPFFMLSFFLPVMFFSLFQEDTVLREREAVLEFFFLLLVVISSVMAAQTVLYWKESPDLRTGGTYEAHMAGILLGVGFVLCLGRKLTGSSKMSGKERFILWSALPLIFLADAKYALVVLLAALCTISVLWIIAHRSRIVPAVLLLGVAVLLIGTWRRILEARVPLGAAELGSGSMPLVTALEGFSVTPRGRILEATLQLYNTDPYILFFGCGPGTFLSRAANSRAYDTMQKSVYDAVGGQREVRSKLPGFVPPFTSWVARKYALDVIHWSTFEQQTWLTGLARWSSSLISFFWEFGALGFAVLLWFYARFVIDGVRRHGDEHADSHIGFGVAAVALFLLGVSFFDLWLETPQFAILHWSLLGLLSPVVMRKQHSERREAAAIIDVSNQ